MKEQVIYIDDIKLTLFKSKKARNVSITLKPFKGVRVSVPRFVTFKQALKFAHKRMDWIKKHYVKMQMSEARKTIFTEASVFYTRKHQLYINPLRTKASRSILKSGKINIFLAHNIDIESAEVQQEIRKGIEKAWRIEAKEFLPIRVKELANQHHFKYRSVAIRNSKTRWGSCSYVNNINLSLYLMRLPDELVDYVILHELVHTRVKDHSKAFWKLLDEVSGNAKGLDKELKQYCINIY